MGPVGHLENMTVSPCLDMATLSVGADLWIELPMRGGRGGGGGTGGDPGLRTARAGERKHEFAFIGVFQAF